MAKTPRQIFIRPLKGAKIRDPFRSGKPFLEAEGELMPDNSYWRRRVKFGEAEIVETPKAVKAQEPSAAKRLKGDRE